MNVKTGTQVIVYVRRLLNQQNNSRLVGAYYAMNDDFLILSESHSNGKIYVPRENIAYFTVG